MNTPVISEVVNDDCMNYMPQFPDKFFDLAIVDPPYGLGKSSTQGSGKLKNRALNRGNIQKWDVKPSKAYFDELFRVSKQQVIRGGNYFELPPTRCFVVWDKVQVWENFSQCEMAWTSFTRSAKHVTISVTGGKADKDKIHGTQKPISLYAYLLRQFAEPEFKILDTHLGSGSSRIASYQMGFDFYSTEIDGEMCDAQELRFRKYCMGEMVVGGAKIMQGSLF